MDVGEPGNAGPRAVRGSQYRVLIAHFLPDDAEGSRGSGVAALGTQWCLRGDTKTHVSFIGMYIQSLSSSS